jgi:hypothetical protein
MQIMAEKITSQSLHITNFILGRKFQQCDVEWMHYRSWVFKPRLIGKNPLSKNETERGLPRTQKVCMSICKVQNRNQIPKCQEQ